MKPDLLQRIKSMLASRSSPHGIKAQIPVTRGLTLIQPARETTRTVTVSVSHVQRLFAVIDVPHNFELFHFYFQDLSSRRPSQKTFHFLYLHQSCPELHQSPGVGFPGQLTIEQGEETPVVNHPSSAGGYSRRQDLVALPRVVPLMVPLPNKDRWIWSTVSSIT